MSELIVASVVIGDRTYRLKIEPRDEEMVRKTVKTINDKIIEYKTQFAGKDMQDYVAMVLIWFATELQTGSVHDVEKENMQGQLDSLEALLDKQL
jgi:cell division protein ZapA (FtsZ GTPase activity inhibitor)